MRLMTALALVFVAVPAYGQENDAEKLFRAMETKIRSAKSQHFVFDGQANGKGMKITVKGDILLAEGDKAKASVEGDFAGQPISMTIVSDGKKVQQTFGGMTNVKDVKPDEKNNEQAVAMSTRTGLVAAFTGIMGPTKKESGKNIDIDKAVPVKDFKLGAKEKVGAIDTQVIEFQMTLPDGSPAKTSVWIDTATQLPVKRELVAQMGGQEFRITENCTVIVSNKVDAKEFELPK